MKRLSSLMLACGLAAISSTAGAQPAPAYVAPDYIRRPPTPPAHFDGGKVLNLTLAQAIEMSVRRNLDLQLSVERVRGVATLRQAAWGLFEPSVFARVGREDVRSPPVTRQEGQTGQVLETTRDVWSLSINERLPIGTELSLEFFNNRTESSLGTAVEPRLFRSGLSLNLRQPLLRDFSFDGDIQMAPVLRADFATEAAREEARLRAMLTVKATEDAYWTLVESYKAYEVTLGALQLAEKQVELTRRQISAGVLPESDLIGAEGTLAQRQLALVRAEVQIERAADFLRGLLNLPVPDWDRPLLPVDAPSFLPVRMDVEPAVARALGGRPELKQVKINLKRIALDMDVARNARLPRVDLEVGVGSVGQDDEYRDVLSQIKGATGRQWNVGLALAWAPLGGAGRAEIRRLESVLRENDLSREQIVVGVRAEIREAVRAIDTADRQLRAAAKSRDLAERSLDVEQRRFLNGLSSNFFVAQRQADLAQARLAELNALIQHEKATSDLQLAMGELLETRNVRFQVRGAS